MLNTHNYGNYTHATFNSSASASYDFGFGTFSFSLSTFGAGAAGGLNTCYQRCPSSPPLNNLGNICNSLAMLQYLIGSFGPNCGGVPSFPSAPSCPTPSLPSLPSFPGSPGCHPPSDFQPTQKGKMWDVFFDAKTGTKTAQWSPIVLDLNGNGKADITGSNIKGNGKLEGTTVKGFDLNLEARQWGKKSVHRRPGNNADALPAGTTAQVFDKDGKLVKTLSADELKKLQSNKSAWNKAGEDMGLSLKDGMRVDFRDKDGKLVGELKQGKPDQASLALKGDKTWQYHWDNKNENEWTKAWDPKTGGDGMLVWDADGDGKITSGKELFGHVDVNGKNTFKNGYEKLAHYFDKNGDGVVKGNELKGLKIWEDRNGDGVTQQGELVDLAKHGIKSLNTSFDEKDMSSSYGFRKPGEASGTPGTPGNVAQQPSPQYHAAMQQAWQLFQTIQVLQQMMQMMQMMQLSQMKPMGGFGMY